MMSVCVCVPKDYINRRADRVLLYNVAAQRSREGLFYNFGGVDDLPPSFSILDDLLYYPPSN